MKNRDTYGPGALCGCLGLGAGLMYLFDPDRGRRRRALLRDRATHTWNKAGDAFEATTRDLNNRARGYMAEAKHLLQREEVADPVLEARIRSRMGRLVSQPRAIQVMCHMGHVTLSGTILAQEADALVGMVSAMRAVTGVEDRLQRRGQPGDIPALHVQRARSAGSGGRALALGH